MYSLSLLLERYFYLHMCPKALFQIQVDCDNPLSLEKNNFISLALLHCFEVLDGVWGMLGCDCKRSMLQMLVFWAFQFLVWILFVFAVSINISHRPRLFSKCRKLVEIWNNSLLFFQTFSFSVLNVPCLGTTMLSQEQQT